MEILLFISLSWAVVEAPPMLMNWVADLNQDDLKQEQDFDDIVRDNGNQVIVEVKTMEDLQRERIVIKK